MTIIQDDPVVPLTPIEPTTLLTVQQFADAYPNKVSAKTVKRWLAAGELPGADRDYRGWWMIPASSRHTPAQTVMGGTGPTPRATSTDVEHVTRPTPRGTTVELMPALVDHRPPELLPQYINLLPTFLTIPQASYLLEISEGTLENPEHREYYHITKVDRHLVVPLYRIKQLRGITG